MPNYVNPFSSEVSDIGDAYIAMMTVSDSRTEETDPFWRSASPKASSKVSKLKPYPVSKRDNQILL